MALIWERRYRGSHYEVRSAGKSLRLYTDGIFHSQWNSAAPLSGNLWDLLILPAFLLTDASANREGLSRACILGVGGGAVLNQLNFFFRLQRLIGVDLDKIHLLVAEKYFGVNQSNTQLRHMSAQQWVEMAIKKEQRFNYLVEDLFLGAVSSSQASNICHAVRAIEANREWLTKLSQLVLPKGLLVMNYESLSQLRRAVALQQDGELGAAGNVSQAGKLFGQQDHQFSAVYALLKPRYHNAIAVYIKGPCEYRSLKKYLLERLALHDALPARHKCGILQFKTQRIR